MPTINFDAPDMSAETPQQKNAPPVAPSPDVPTETTDQVGVGEAAKDLLLRGVGGGVEQAARGTYETVKAGAGAVGVDLPELGDPFIEEPKAVPAQIVRDMTQFGLGFVGGMNLLRVTGAAAKLAPVAKEIIASGIGTGVVADPNAPRLSNLIEKYPYLENPVTEYLASDSADSVAESKFKSSLEDMLTTPAAMVLFKTVKALRSASKGDAAETAKLSDEIVQDVKGANAAQEADLTLPEIKITPEDGAAKQADEYSKLGRITAGGEHYAKLDEAKRAKLESEIDANPEATYKLSEGKDGEIRAYRNAVVINDKAGKPLFSLTDEEMTQFQKHVDHMISQNRTEDIFNVPEFSLFNARKSEASFDTQEVLDSMWSLVKPKVEKHMDDVRRHAETEKLAKVMGENPASMIGNIRMVAKNADDFDKYIVAGKALLYDMAREARSLATRINFETASPEEIRALDHLRTNMADLMGSVTSLRKGAARATSAGNIKTGGEFNDQAIADLAKVANEGDVRKFAQRLSLAESDEAAIRTMKDQSVMGKLVDSHNEIWINGILSGPKTHVVNMVSAATTTLLKPANQIIGGTIMRSPQDVQEGMAIYRGLRTNLFDSFDMARRAFKTETAILDPGKTTDEVIGHSVTAKNWNLDENGALGRAVDWIGLVARIPSRFLKSEDEFFKQMNYRSKVMAQAAREGTAMVQAGKLQENELDKFIQDRFESAFNATDAGTNKAGLRYAREATFTQDLNDIKTYDWFGNPGARIQQFATGHPWLRGAILPFIKVPTNLMRAVGDYTPPIAALKKEGMDILTGKDVDPTRRAEFVGRLTTGSMFWTAASLLALEGRITGSAYGDKDMRDRQMETGWQPYSLKLGDKYISFNRNDPYGMFFGLAADYAYLMNHIDENSKHSLATAMTLAIAKNLSSKSYLQGLVEQASMLGGGYTAEEQIGRYFQNRAASYLPAYFTLYTGNDELKNVRTVMDAMMAKIPGLTDKVEAKRDYFGEKRMAPMGAPWNAIDPYPVSTDKQDAVRSELARLSRSQAEAKFSMPDAKLGTIDLTQYKNEKGQTAYDRWTELLGTVTIGGSTFHEKLADVIDSPRYKDGADGLGAYSTGNRVVMIRNEQERYRTKALREMLNEFDDQAPRLGFNLRDMASQDKRNERSVKHGKTDAVQDILNLR